MFIDPNPIILVWRPRFDVPHYRKCWFAKVDFPVWELRSEGTRQWTLIAQLASFGVGSLLTWRQWLGGKVTIGVSELRHDMTEFSISGSKAARHMVVGADGPCLGCAYNTVSQPRWVEHGPEVSDLRQRWPDRALELLT